MKKQTRLSRQEKELLHQVIERRASSLIRVVQELEKEKLTTEEREALRGILADELSDHGLKEDWEPNEYGRRIDDLIGRLGEV